MRDYSVIIKDYLDSNGISNVFAGSEKPASAHIPQDSVFCAEYGGAQPESSFGTSVQIHRIDLQVLVRSEMDGEQTSKTLANDIYDLLRNASPTGTLIIRPKSTPIRLGVDEDGVYRFTVNVTVVAQE